jgi:hypothetical protein
MYTEDQRHQLNWISPLNNTLFSLYMINVMEITWVIDRTREPELSTESSGFLCLDKRSYVQISTTHVYWRNQIFRTYGLLSTFSHITSIASYWKKILNICETTCTNRIVYGHKSFHKYTKQPRSIYTKKMPFNKKGK